MQKSLLQLSVIVQNCISVWNCTYTADYTVTIKCQFYREYLMSEKEVISDTT